MHVRTNGDFDAPLVIVEVQGFEQLDEGVLQRPDQEWAFPVPCMHTTAQTHVIYCVRTCSTV